ncbi:MAG TPA: COX15/CtaA family protein [Opitutaceae bacterium]|nr:COX15/CtaA family protein [Opitutaceae bacterium]
MAAYKPGLAAFAGATVAWAFVPVVMGAFTTTIGAGMVFPDWPLSNGSLNPTGWLQNVQMFAEHSHRLTVGVLSFLTVGLAIWLQRREERRWLRQLGWFAVVLVFAQALLGGLRVLFVSELLAGIHACVAQAFVCTLLAIAAGCTRGWIAAPVPVSGALRRAGTICCVFLFIQLGIAAVMRHSQAGLAIPFFPWSGPGHRLLPEAWDFKIAIHFAHRLMALVVACSLAWFAVKLWRDPGATLGMRSGASAMVSLVALQILLGAAIIRTYRDPMITTAHVVVGALTLATTFWITWRAHRDLMESPAAP